MGKKISLRTWQSSDWKIMEDHLQRMAEKGWLFESHRLGITKYKKNEPQELEFAVSIYPKSKAYEGFDRKEIDEYVVAQTDKGWTYVSTFSNVNVFYKKSGEASIPLDRRFQIDNIRSDYIKNAVGLGLILLINLFNLFKLFSVSSYMFYSNGSLSSLIVLPLFYFILLISFLESLLIIYKIKKVDSLEDYNMSRLLSGIRSSFSWISILMLLLFFGLIASDEGVQFLRVAASVVPVALGIGVAFFLKKKFTGKGFDPVLKFTLVTIGVFVVIFATSSKLASLDNNQDTRILPPDRPAIRLNEAVNGALVDDTYFKEAGSILMPVRYEYSEYGKDLRVATEVMRLRSPRLAEHIYDLKLEEMTKYFSSFWPAESYMDKVDKANYVTINTGDTSEGGAVVILDGQWIFVYRLPLDLETKAVNELIADKMEETVKIID